MLAMVYQTEHYSPVYAHLLEPSDALFNLGSRARALKHCRLAGGNSRQARTSCRERLVLLVLILLVGLLAQLCEIGPRFSSSKLMKP